jgi:hypothetical protein
MGPPPRARNGNGKKQLLAQNLLALGPWAINCGGKQSVFSTAFIDPTEFKPLQFAEVGGRSHIWSHLAGPRRSLALRPDLRSPS